MRTCIIGLGWLGQPLAFHLQEKGHEVWGTTRNSDKCARLNTAGIGAMLFDLSDPLYSDTLSTSAISQANFTHSNVIINIAPGRRTIEIAPYVDAMCQLIKYVFDKGAKHLTFVSTTSVFGEKSGLLNETSMPEPLTGSGIAHWKIESYLMSTFGDKAAVIRLAGLIGHNIDGSLRHPVTSLVIREGIPNGHQPVNLLHQVDAIACITAIISGHKSGRVFHACAQDHPSRKDYYEWAAKTLKLGHIHFLNEERDSMKEGKIVDAINSLESLKVELQYPSPFDML